MIAEDLAQHATDVASLVESLTQRQLDPIIARWSQEGRWELMGVALITAGELAARLLAGSLIENRQFEALVPAACLRRELRQPSRPGVGQTNVFRDWDAEEGGEGIPEFIKSEAEDIAASAAARRQTATYQAAGVDRDPLREYIVTRLAEQMDLHPEATQALATIARASAWEETRRMAAMKVTNSRRGLARLVQEAPGAAVAAVARATGMQAARQKVAQVMAERLAQYQADGDRVALEFLVENLADAAVRAQAEQARAQLPG